MLPPSRPLVHVLLSRPSRVVGDAACRHFTMTASSFSCPERMADLSLRLPPYVLSRRRNSRNGSTVCVPPGRLITVAQPALDFLPEVISVQQEQAAGRSLK
ncbi:hypothetical protein INR49_021347 [Caranx melampygus]|nr:hypothetical protein INR49_021347 [Caranx melampygus]